MIGSIFVRILLFLLVFAVEVRVKAQEPITASEEILQQPERCLEGNIETPCAIQTDSEGAFELNLAGGKVILDRDTTLIRLSDHEVRLVAGTLWLQPSGHKSLSVKTEFGEARSKSEFWVARESERMTVSASFKDVEMLPKGTSETLTVPSGLENSLGRVTKEGRAWSGFPTPIQPATHLARWARLYKGKKEAFEKEVAAFKARWLSAKNDATEMQQTLYRRKLASLESAANERLQARQKTEARNRELREHFRRRVLGEE